MHILRLLIKHLKEEGKECPALNKAIRIFAIRDALALGFCALFTAFVIYTLLGSFFKSAAVNIKQPHQPVWSFSIPNKAASETWQAQSQAHFCALWIELTAQKVLLAEGAPQARYDAVYSLQLLLRDAIAAKLFDPKACLLLPK